METEIKIPQTLKDAIELFRDEEFSFRFAVNLRGPDGVKCPYYGCDRSNERSRQAVDVD